MTIILLSSTSSATIAGPDPEEWTGSFSGGIDLWYMSPQSFRKAGLNIQNEHNNPYLVTGIQMTFNLSEAPGYKAKVQVQRGDLGEDQDASVEHQIEGFRYGNEKKQSFLFTETDYLIVDQNYNIQFRPLRSDHLVLQHYDDDVDRSRYWDPETGDWDTMGTSPSSPSLDGKEWAMSALVEPVKPIEANQPQTDTFVPPDAVDAYFAELTMGKTYVFFLEHSKSSNFQLYIYSDRDQLKVPGKMTEETILVNTSGSEPEKKVTWTAEYGGRHYILVKPAIGSGTYEIKYQENQEPIAEAGDDVYANLKLGGSVPVTFENTLSYDPDDDKNNNGKIDLTEDNNLQYYWDFDSETDTDGDGNYTNDEDAIGEKLTHTFTKGGKFTVTLTVEDPHGASDTDTLELYLNYIPIVKMEVSYSDEDNAYVDQKLTFSAEGSYDPDDDLNGNGVIDGSEVDHLTYSWDFYDAIDKNMDGNKTNDTDASNNMWLMKYPKAGTYTITLNVWDNPEPADRAYNHSQLVLEVMEKLPEVELEIDYDIDYSRDKTNNLDVTDDVLVREKKGSRETTFSAGGWDVINLVRITAENDGNTWYLKLFTQGNIVEQSEKNTDVYYSYYIVRTPYKEQKVTKETMANIEVFYIYNFTFHDNKLTVTDENGEDVSTVGMEVFVEEDMLQINVSFRELTLLVDELKEFSDHEMDFFSVFAMGIYKSSKTVGGETQRIFARDSIGTGTQGGSLAGEVEESFFSSSIMADDDDDSAEGIGDKEGDWSLLILTGLGLLFVGVLAGAFGYSRIKRKEILENETRHNIYTYINQYPGSHYTKIKKKLNISDNTLAHHINKLKEAELIKIRSRGNFKFYYPTWMNEGKLLTPMQKKIIDIIKTRPGVTSKHMAVELGKEPRTIRYHIGNIADMGLVRAETVDNSSHWYAVQGKMGKDGLT